jgi:signal transduction histidine kinase
MLSPAYAIYKDVNDLCNPKESEEKEDTKQLADDIQRQGKTIAELLNNLLHVSEEETGKEVDHE